MLLVNFVPAYFDQAHDLCVVVELAHASAIRVRDGARGRRASVDANGDRYEAPHEANLFDMNAKYADVMSEQEALDYIASQKLNATAGRRAVQSQQIERDIMTMNRRTAMAALTAMAIIPAQAYATDWPTKPVTIYVTTAAGGNTDIMARMGAEYLTTKFGKTFVVENRPSAGGVQATGQVVNAAPDGYSILFSHSAAVLLAPLVQKMSFDPDKSLTPVTNVGTGSQVVAIKRSLPVNNLAEFLAYAKANPKKLNFAAAGTNNISHLAPLLLFARAGADVVMVPSRGEPQAISDLIAGNVDFYFGNTSVLLAQKDHPAIKLLAVGTAQRVASAPEIPTVSETVPGFVFASWNGFFVPNGTPEDIVEKLRGAITEMVKEPQMAARLTSLGILPGGQNKEQVAAAFQNDRKNFADAVKAAGIPAP